MRRVLPEVYPRLWRFCLALSGSRDGADELAQATCARALDKAHLFDPGSQADRWLFTMARRIRLNDLRATKVRLGRGVEDCDALADPRTSKGAESNIFAREVFDQIAALSDVQRTAVVLVYVEGYKYAEAAEMLDVPVGTIMSRLAAARRKLAPLAGPGEDA